jgi:hypothetical protein
MSEYNFEEERGDQDYNYDRFDMVYENDDYQPSEDMINDWNIDNDHREDNENEMFAPCWQRECTLDVCDIPEHFMPTDSELDKMFS